MQIIEVMQTQTNAEKDWKEKKNLFKLSDQTVRRKITWQNDFIHHKSFYDDSVSEPF